MYAMLESTPLVDGVITDLRRTQSILDDLDESLKVRASMQLLVLVWLCRQRLTPAFGAHTLPLFLVKRMLT